MEHWNAESPIDDLAYPTRSQHRIPALVTLTERPDGHAERCEVTRVSSPTIRQTLNEFEDGEENRFLSPYQKTTPIQHDEFAVICLNTITTNSGDECWTRWAQ
jgi:hypothetical protein